LLEVDEKAPRPEGKKPGYFKHQNLRENCHVSPDGRCNVLAKKWSSIYMEIHGPIAP